MWVDGEPREVGPAEFAPDLSARRRPALQRVVGARGAHATCCSSARDYRQPFGTFSGALPGGVELAEGFGVMEEHDVWW